MKLKVNGETVEVKDGKSILEMFEEINIKAVGIAVELNGEIVPKSSHAETVLKEDDVLEVVNMVGGG